LTGGEGYVKVQPPDRFALIEIAGGGRTGIDVVGIDNVDGRKDLVSIENGIVADGMVLAIAAVEDIASKGGGVQEGETTTGDKGIVGRLEILSEFLVEEGREHSSLMIDGGFSLGIPSLMELGEVGHVERLG
jgi:hypothetical protein